MARRKKTIAKKNTEERELRKAERAANAENRRQKIAARKAAMKAARKGYKKYTAAEREGRYTAMTQKARTVCDARIAKAEAALARARASKTCARAARAYLARAVKEKARRGSLPG